MKNTRLTSVIFLGLGMLYFGANAQSLSDKLKDSKVIYVAPLTDFDYFAIKQAKNNSKGAFDHKGSYEVGDFVDDAVDPNVSYEIVGSVSSEKLDELNNLVLNKLRSIYGDDKVKSWPADMTNKMTGMWDQKNIDCDYYFIFKRMSSNNPIIVNIVSTSNPGVSPRVAGGTDMITIGLYEKAKAGKKGKVVAKAKNAIFKGVDPVEYSGDYKQSANKLTEMATSNFSKVVEGTIDDLLKEISTN